MGKNYLLYEFRTELGFWQLEPIIISGKKTLISFDLSLEQKGIRDELTYTGGNVIAHNNKHFIAGTDSELTTTDCLDEGVSIIKILI